jgi:hypothetical protein
MKPRVKVRTMYRYLDKLLAEEKKHIRAEFNHLSVMGFDELNVVNTRKATQEMYDSFMKANENMYLKAARDAYKKAVSSAKDEGYLGEKTEIDRDWLVGVLVGYNLVTGYLYNKECCG